MEGKVWVPEKADELNLKFFTVTDAGKSGHRGGQATTASIPEKLNWRGKTTDAKDFVANCLLCVLSRSGSKLHRPIATTLHASKRNEVLNFDYLFLGESEDETKYALVIKDDFSGFAWIRATPEKPRHTQRTKSSHITICK